MVNNVSNTGSKSSNKLLMLVLLMTVIATAWTALEEDDVTDELLVIKTSQAPTAMMVRSNQQQASALTVNTLSNGGKLIPWQSLKREPLSDKPYDLFKVRSWVVIPPVKKMKPQPLPPPVAPPAPFTYIGKLEDSPKGTQVFLMANGKLYSVVKGEKINHQWRLDTEDANTLRLTYLPLNLVQTLSKSAKLAVIAATSSATAELIQ
ncbi:MAG: hypothetical protein Q7U70_02815 [Methylotenera sp.]|nr:hypothetical protein [Methylotenera sp.]MDP2402454.1 hypothetical protein [Methylotenera sp.]MDZ4222339.1 hypothetical protein [Methylotenera sp.]